MSRGGRGFAAVLALAGWASLGLQTNLDITRALAHGGSVTGALWRMAGFYTILTNLLAAAVLTAAALDRKWARIPALTGVTVYMTMLGLLNHFLLGGVHNKAGGWLAADLSLHYALPALVLVFWWRCVPKAGLRWAHPWLWLAYPLLYLGYILTRGQLSGWYPYFVVDAGRYGLGPVLRNACFLTLGFLLAGHGFVAWARLAERRGHHGAPASAKP